jgi:hypothetical protein
MDGPWIVALIGLIILALILFAWRRGRSGGDSTAGHYDPDAIGGYSLDPATMGYRYELPTLPRSRRMASPGSGPPRRRRRRRRPGAHEG